MCVRHVAEVRAVISAERSRAGGHQWPAARRAVAAEAWTRFGRSAGYRERDTCFNVHGAFHRDVECKEVFRVGQQPYTAPHSTQRRQSRSRPSNGARCHSTPDIRWPAGDI